MKNVVVIGGGKGQSALLRGLKKIEELSLTAIVTVADDGGSTGRLREAFNIPAMGDIRNVMLSLAESESLLATMMNYRFDENIRSDLAGHNLGNLIFTALNDTSGNFMDAILQLSQVLNVRGKVVPASTDMITLCALMDDGTIVRGESNIPKYQNSINKVYYDDDVKATEEAIEAILEADVIVMGIGSIYTSILPNLIIPGINEAVRQSKAKKVYYCNAMSQPGETDGFSGEDHVNALLRHVDIQFDAVVASDDIIPKEILQRYFEEDSYPIVFNSTNHVYNLVYQKLISFENNYIRHDADCVEKGFYQVMEVMGCPLAVKSNTK